MQDCSTPPSQGNQLQIDGIRQSAGKSQGPTLWEEPVLDAEVAGQCACMVCNLDWDQEEVVVNLCFILAGDNDWLLNSGLLHP